MADPIPVFTFSVTLSPGETIVLPSDAIITGVFADGNAEIVSSCTGTLPVSSDYVCGVFYMNIDDDNSDNHPNDEDHTYYRKLIVDTMEFDLDGLLNNTNDPDYLNSFVNIQPIFTFTNINRFTIDDSGDNKRKAVYLYFKVAEPYFDKVKLQIVSHVGHTRPNAQIYLPLTEDEQAGAGDLECGEYPF
jgi:hypothetical protein